MSTALVSEIRQRLTNALAPSELQVLDEGAKHAGHAHAGEGHFHVCIVSAMFMGTTLVARHRLVYAALGSLMGKGIHALSIDARAP